MCIHNGTPFLSLSLFSLCVAGSSYVFISKRKVGAEQMPTIAMYCMGWVHWFRFVSWDLEYTEDPYLVEKIKGKQTKPIS